MALLLGAAQRGGLAAGHAGGAAGRRLHPRAWAASCCSAPRCWRSPSPSPASYVADLGDGGGRRGGDRRRWRALVSSLLAVDEDELFFRRARRRAGRADGADDRPPGVLFLQIDAPRPTTPSGARSATASMPHLAALAAVGQPHADLLAHRLELADRREPCAASCTAPTTTSSASAGTRRTATTSSRVSHPVDAAEVERRHSDGRGLLAGDGASRGNLFTGDAAARQPDHELAGARRARAASRRQRRTRRPRRRGLLRLLRQPGERRAHPRRLDRRHRPRAGRGGPRAPGRRPPAGRRAAGIYPLARPGRRR